jgi:biopolymer transport protein ExbD
MSIGAADDGEEQMNSTINTTPLVDVMLVLQIGRASCRERVS